MKRRAASGAALVGCSLSRDWAGGGNKKSSWVTVLRGEQGAAARRFNGTDDEGSSAQACE